MTGLHLSQYRIESELGRGGMGIVYRATDTKLNRTVALKVLPPSALASEDDRARFFREAQAAAQLHHPNIATVFQIDEAVPLSEDGKVVEGHSEKRPFIAMEFVEGETLSDYIKKGPVKLQDAVNITAQVAEALKAAHAKDIVHRDIKSANVMLTEDGIAKVLDFGLAKTNASTMLTRVGSTLGTVAYMSPEQARGQEVDGRTDLYALGTMLYEMVAGRLPFAGDYEQAILYSILNEPPEPLTAVRTGVPMDLERVVSKLLSKEADYRYQSAAGLLADLKSLDLTGSGVSRRSMAAMSAATMPAAAKTGAGTPTWVWGAMAGIAIVALAAGWLIKPTPDAVESPVRRLTSHFSPAAVPMGRISLSADGRAMATISMEEAGRSGVVRFFDEEEARVLPVLGSGAPPALSPDGRWIAYHDGQTLYRVATTGGSPEIVAEINGEFVSWLSNDEVVTDSLSRALYRVPEFGPPQFVDLGLAPSESIAHVSAIPDTPIVLYSRWSSTDEYLSVFAVNLDSGDSERVVERASWGRYHPAGYVLFHRNGDIHAVPFDLDSFEVGRSFVVQAGVGRIGETYQVLFDVSAADIMAFYAGSGGDSEMGGRELVLIDRNGTTTPVGVERKGYWDPRLSPDGRLILTHAASDNGGADIWLVDTVRGTTRRMTTNPVEDETAFWSPQGTHFYYSADGDSTEYILRQSVDGSTPIDTLLEDTQHKHVESVSSDDRYVVIASRGDSAPDLWVIDRQEGNEARQLTSADAIEQAGKISPDGRLIAYQSDESGRVEVYVAQFPTMLAVQPVSVDGGFTPVWSEDGEQLYYLSENRLMSVDFSGGEPGDVEEVMALDTNTYITAGHTAFDVLGDRFVFIRTLGGSSSYETIQLVTGVGTLLKSLDPGRE